MTELDELKSAVAEFNRARLEMVRFLDVGIPGKSVSDVSEPLRAAEAKLLELVPVEM